VVCWTGPLITVTHYGDSALIDTGTARGQTGAMACLARIVVPDVPHHVTQRGNGRFTVTVYSVPFDFSILELAIAGRLCVLTGTARI